MSQLTRERTAEPKSRDKTISDLNGDRENNSFLCEPSGSSRDCNPDQVHAHWLEVINVHFAIGPRNPNDSEAQDKHEKELVKL